jgi:isopentenyl-diphosphate delta-isomerase
LTHDVSIGAAPTPPVVSFDTEPLILVDDADREIGHMGKLDCHQGHGVLHRAFSLFIFNDEGELLLQQRSDGKRLWPLYWSNSCCSHPRRGETMTSAVHRRLYEELGMECPLQFLFKFQYQAQYDASHAENELCSVFIGHNNGPARFNRNEIASCRWIHPEQLQVEITQRGGTDFTPWFKMEWARMRQHHGAALTSLAGAPQWASR